jgi:hypothetical protein
MHARSTFTPWMGSLNGCIHPASAPPVNDAAAAWARCNCARGGTRPGRRRQRPGSGVVCADASHESQRQARASRVHALAVPAAEAEVDGRTTLRRHAPSHPEGDTAKQVLATHPAGAPRTVAGGARRALRARLLEGGRTPTRWPAAPGAGLFHESRGASTHGVAHHTVFTPAVAPLVRGRHRAELVRPFSLPLRARCAPEGNTVCVCVLLTSGHVRAVPGVAQGHLGAGPRGGDDGGGACPSARPPPVHPSAVR